MSEIDTLLSAQVRAALRGTNQFVEPVRALAAFPWTLAGKRPGGAEHSVFRLVNHMIFWQELALERVAGHDRPSPAHDPEGWPGKEEPADEPEWHHSLTRFASGIARAEQATEEGSLTFPLPAWGGRTRFEGLLGLALHNAHHTGQIIQLRKMLGAWPPPGGGDSW